mmetsp:Transcript_6879/g.20929  ORF Transcript_6879/g.20929 Transcript_6879/m.20929 type:complete len:220 (-) Transcript_6879:242-901(-)
MRTSTPRSSACKDGSPIGSMPNSRDSTSKNLLSSPRSSYEKTHTVWPGVDREEIVLRSSLRRFREYIASEATITSMCPFSERIFSAVVESPHQSSAMSTTPARLIPFSRQPSFREMDRSSSWIAGGTSVAMTFLAPIPASAIAIRPNPAPSSTMVRPATSGMGSVGEAHILASETADRHSTTLWPSSSLAPCSPRGPLRMHCERYIGCRAPETSMASSG